MLNSHEIVTHGNYVRHVIAENLINFTDLSTSADGFPFIEEVEDVSTPLMMQPENWPKGLHLPLSLMGLRFSWNTEENQES